MVAPLGSHAAAKDTVAPSVSLVQPVEPSPPPRARNVHAPVSLGTVRGLDVRVGGRAGLVAAQAEAALVHREPEEPLRVDPLAPDPRQRAQPRDLVGARRTAEERGIQRGGPVVALVQRPVRRMPRDRGREVRVRELAADHGADAGIEIQDVAHGGEVEVEAEDLAPPRAPRSFVGRVGEQTIHGLAIVVAAARVALGERPGRDRSDR